MVNIVNKLVGYFYKGYLNFSLQPQDIKEFTLDKQEDFLNATLRKETVMKYPVSNEFTRLFLKKIINHLESYQEISDEVYEQLCTVLKSGMDTEFCFRHYVINNDFNNLITIKETKNMVVNGTTGMKTWQAALMLADFALCNKNIFDGKKVLELGSGIGFTGIAIAKNCNAMSIVLSDCHCDVIRTICENIKINFPDAIEEGNERITKFKDKQQNIDVMMLDWNSIEDVLTNIVPDILIGADIIYDPTILKPLCNTIKTFSVRNKQLKVFITNIIRNNETYNQFLETLEQYGLAYEELPQDKSIFIEWDCSVDKCLLKIENKI